MSIPFRRYVDITSGVGAGAGVRTRDLIARLFTSNPLLPTGSYAEFSSADAVAAYFGSTSDEYKRAAFYFGFTSKNITRPQKISFARWVNADVAPLIYGRPGDQALATWNAISSGSFYLTIGLDTDLGPNTHLISGLDFGAAASLSAVAAIIQTAIRAASISANWTGATVTWDATRKSFNLVGGAVGDAEISVEAGDVGTDIASQLGWLTGAILSNGADEETVTDTLITSASASDNFGSFLFMPALTNDQIEEAAIWNDTQNVKYQFMVRVTSATYGAIYTLVSDLSGTGLTLAPLATEYPEMLPMAILAATNYAARSSVQNYMFQIASLTPSVTSEADADTYDNSRVNYYGRTQTAGQIIQFYQRGVLTGLPVDPVDMNTYANEQWLKDAAGAAIMALLLAKSLVSANKQGRSELITTVQSIIDQALFNGTISVGKPLNTTQKIYIGEITGDPLAWHQVQNIGYWLDCVITSYVTQDGRTEWKAVYTLVYSKDDAIRKVEGTHILI